MYTISQSNPTVRCKRKLLAGALMIAGTSFAHAGNNDNDRIFSFSGFGTAGFAHSSSKDGDYTANFAQPSGSGASRSWSPIDSKLAGQLTARVNDQFSAVVQVVATTRPNNRFEPKFEWAYLKYAVTPELNVLVGRTVLPTFMNSETRLLGYSSPSVRPPIETYNQNPTTNLDGASIAYRRNIAGVTNTAQVFYGKNEVTIVGATGTLIEGIEGRKIRGLVDTLEFGSWTVRGSISFLELAIPLAPGFTLHAPHVKQVNLGAVYDPGNWFVQGEVSSSQNILATRNTRSAYVTAGIRIDAFTPYATYSRVKPNGAMRPVNNDQVSTAVGVRWDAIKNVAVKAQFDHVNVGDNSFGSFVNVKPGMAGGSSNVASIAVDFVF